MKILPVFTYSTALCWLVLGCNGIFEPEFETEVITRIENQSAHDIELRVIHLDSLDDRIFLGASQSVGDTTLEGSRFLFRADSVNVVFDDTLLVGHNRFNSYGVSRDIRNMYDSWDRQVLVEEKYHELLLYQYIFTNADFEEALEKGRKVE